MVQQQALPLTILTVQRLTIPTPAQRQMLHTLRRQVHLLQRTTAAAPALTRLLTRPVDINAATHTVVRGDTVYNISKRYNITPRQSACME